MKPGRLKALGTVLLLLAVVGTLSSWSVTGDERLAYTVANALLFILGTATLVLGYWRSRVRRTGMVQERTD